MARNQCSGVSNISFCITGDRGHTKARGGWETLMWHFPPEIFCTIPFFMKHFKSSFIINLALPECSLFNWPFGLDTSKGVCWVLFVLQATCLTEVCQPNFNKPPTICLDILLGCMWKEAFIIGFAIIEKSCLKQGQGFATTVRKVQACNSRRYWFFLLTLLRVPVDWQLIFVFSVTLFSI